MTGTSRRVVIVGGSIAGTRTALELRNLGFDGEIVLVGDEPHLPYDRPPLSKQVLAGSWTLERTELKPPDAWVELGVELLLDTEAVGLDRNRVVLANREPLRFDDLVVATGASPRRLAGHPEDERFHVLRTRDDSARLRDRLIRAGSLLVVGGGFIGAEVAAVARGLGVEVTLVEAAPAPFARVLGDEVAALCARLHLDHGIRVLAGRATTGFLTDGSQAGVVLDDGTELRADEVLVGVGSVPNVGWLVGSEVPIDDGVLCGPTGRVDGLDHVHALGDVASWFDPRYGDRGRVEHWTNATDQARVVAQSVLGLAPDQVPLPYFWSDQYRTKIQLIGRPDLADSVEIAGLPGRAGAAVATYSQAERVVAAVTFSAPHVLAKLRPLVAELASRRRVEETLQSLGLPARQSAPTP